MPLPLTVIPIPGPGAEDVLVAPDGRVWTGTADGAIHVHDPATGDDHHRHRHRRPPARPREPPRRPHPGLRRPPRPARPRPRHRRPRDPAHRGRRRATPVLQQRRRHRRRHDLVQRLQPGLAGRGVEERPHRAHPHRPAASAAPPTAHVTTVLDQLCFANGVALTAEADAVLVAETGTRTIRRVHLTADGTAGRHHHLGRRPARPPRQHRPRQRRPGLGDGGLADRQGPDACCRRARERCAAWCAGSPSA